MSERADLYLVKAGIAASRSEAQAAIAAGRVSADGVRVLKASQKLRDGASIQYAPAHPYVSRGGVKLAAALDAYGLSPENLVCLDIGASTGGFTEVLLGRGAARVYAIDSGHGQLHPRVAQDPRVIAHEGLNARALSRAQVPEPPQVLVADVSFISLTVALPGALSLAAPGAWGVFLVKPQFEAGSENVPRDGVIKDEKLRRSALAAIETFLMRSGWDILGSMESPIEGGEGNREYLLAARKKLAKA